MLHSNNLDKSKLLLMVLDLFVKHNLYQRMLIKQYLGYFDFEH